MTGTQVLELPHTSFQSANHHEAELEAKKPGLGPFTDVLHVRADPTLV